MTNTSTWASVAKVLQSFVVFFSALKAIRTSLIKRDKCNRFFISFRVIFAVFRSFEERFLSAIM